MMNKRLVSMLLVLCMVFTTLPAGTANAVSDAGGQTPAALQTNENSPSWGLVETQSLGEEESEVPVYEIEVLPLVQQLIDKTTGDLHIKLADGYYEVNGTLTIASDNPHNITIDLNGHKLYVGDEGTVIEHNGSGTLTIIDSGEGGSVEAGANAIAIKNVGSGNVCVKGGTVSAGYYAILNQWTGSVYVCAGKVYSPSASAIYNHKNGKIFISGSAVVSSDKAWNEIGTICLNAVPDSDTYLEITGGTIENTATGGTAIQNNGDGRVSIPSGSAVIRGKYQAMNKAPELGANMLATASANYDGSLAGAYDKNSVQSYKYLKVEQAIAKIGDTGYTSLQAAVDAVENGQTIKLLLDTTESIVIAQTNAKSFTLDLNGKTMYGADENPAIMHMGSGMLTLTGGEVITTHEIAPAVCNYGAGTVNINGGAVRSGYVAIDNISTGSVRISGGEVQNTGVGCAISTYGSGKIYISGSALITSACEYAEKGTILINDGTAENTVVTITGGTIENTAEGGNAVYNAGSGIIAIPSGEPIIKGRGMAMNTAPNLKNYPYVTVTASSNYDGSSAVEKYKADDIKFYKYLGFEQGFAAAIGKVAFVYLAEAFGTVKDGQTITLLNDVREQITIPNTNAYSFTLDLNGHGLYSSMATSIKHSGSGMLTITDSGEGGRILSNFESAIVLDGGSLIVESGIIETTGISAIHNTGTGSVQVLGGQVKGSSSSSIAINTITGKVTIGGDAIITSAISPSIGGLGKGTIYLQEGNASQTILEIKGGTIENTRDDGIAIYNYGSGKIAITDGTPVIRGKGKAMNKAPDVSTYVRPLVTASTNFDGSSAVDTYNAKDIGSYKYIKVEHSPKDVAEIGIYGYPSLSAAVSSVSNGQTIKLLKDTKENITVYGDLSFTLDLNGKTLPGGANAATITHAGSGTLTITDTVGGGIVSSPNGNTIMVTGEGTLVIEGGTVDNEFALPSNDGKAINNSGSGTVRVLGGTVQAQYVAILNDATGSVHVLGGEVKNTGSKFAIVNKGTGKIHYRWYGKDNQQNNTIRCGYDLAL